MSKYTGAVIGVSRVALLPDPWVPSIERPCAECGERCWLSLATRDAVIAIEGTLPPVICEVCMPDVIKEHEE